MLHRVRRAVERRPLREQPVLADRQEVRLASRIRRARAVGLRVPAGESVAGLLEGALGDDHLLIYDALGGPRGARAAVRVVGERVGVGRVVEPQHERAVGGHRPGGDRPHAVLVEERLICVAGDVPRGRGSARPGDAFVLVDGEPRRLGVVGAHLVMLHPVGGHSLLPLREDLILPGRQDVNVSRGIGPPGSVGFRVPAGEHVPLLREGALGDGHLLADDALGGRHRPRAAVRVVGERVGVGRVVEPQHERAVGGDGARRRGDHAVLVERGPIRAAGYAYRPRDGLGPGRADVVLGAHEASRCAVDAYLVVLDAEGGVRPRLPLGIHRHATIHLARSSELVRERRVVDFGAPSGEVVADARRLRRGQRRMVLGLPGHERNVADGGIGLGVAPVLVERHRPLRRDLPGVTAVRRVRLVDAVNVQLGRCSGFSRIEGCVLKHERIVRTCLLRAHVYLADQGRASRDQVVVAGAVKPILGRVEPVLRGARQEPRRALRRAAHRQQGRHFGIEGLVALSRKSERTAVDEQIAFDPRRAVERERAAAVDRKVSDVAERRQLVAEIEERHGHARAVHERDVLELADARELEQAPALAAAAVEHEPRFAFQVLMVGFVPTVRLGHAFHDAAANDQRRIALDTRIRVSQNELIDAEAAVKLDERIAGDRRKSRFVPRSRVGDQRAVRVHVLERSSVEHDMRRILGAFVIGDERLLRLIVITRAAAIDRPHDASVDGYLRRAAHHVVPPGTVHLLGLIRIALLADVRAVFNGYMRVLHSRVVAAAVHLHAHDESTLRIRSESGAPHGHERVAPHASCGIAESDLPAVVLPASVEHAERARHEVDVNIPRHLARFGIRSAPAAMEVRGVPRIGIGIVDEHPHIAADVAVETAAVHRAELAPAQDEVRVAGNVVAPAATTAQRSNDVTVRSVGKSRETLRRLETVAVREYLGVDAPAAHVVEREVADEVGSHAGQRELLAFGAAQRDALARNAREPAHVHVVRGEFDDRLGGVRGFDGRLGGRETGIVADFVRISRNVGRLRIRLGRRHALLARPISCAARHPGCFRRRFRRRALLKLGRIRRLRLSPF